MSLTHSSVSLNVYNRGSRENTGSWREIVFLRTERDARGSDSYRKLLRSESLASCSTNSNNRTF